jgi:hypothetical protein
MRYGLGAIVVVASCAGVMCATGELETMRDNNDIPLCDYNMICNDMVHYLQKSRKYPTIAPWYFVKSSTYPKETESNPGLDELKNLLDEQEKIEKKVRHYNTRKNSKQKGYEHTGKPQCNAKIHQPDKCKKTKR